MKNKCGRYGVFGGILLCLLLGLVKLQGQGLNTLTVTASSGSPSPNPACVGDSITASLTATISNPPSGGSYSCPIQGPYWSWVVQSVQYKALQSDTWGPSPGGDSESIYQPSSNSPDATLTASFSQAGYWMINLGATVTYNDSPCNDVWSGTGITTVTDTVINVSFWPSPVCVVLGQTASLQATVTPADAASLVNYTTTDSSIATISGTNPSNLTVTGMTVGTTTGEATLSGSNRVCATDMIDVVGDPNYCSN